MFLRNSIEAKSKTIDFDDDINKYIYDLAVADSGALILSRIHMMPI
jgi:hypothetical protein